MGGDLDGNIYKAVVRLSEEGNSRADAGDFAGALEKYEEALRLLPNPLDQWEAATWLLTSIGEMRFFLKRLPEARDALQAALLCPGGLGTPFIHLRLGQVQLDLHNTERAKDELARAYMGGGDEIFEGEDPKYWRFIIEILKPEPRDTSGGGP